MSNELVINQRKLGHSRIFQLADENLTYTLRDPSGERTFSVPYENVDTSNVSHLRLPNARFAQMLSRAALAGFVASFAIAAINNPVGAIVGIVSAVSIFAIWGAYYAGWFSVGFTNISMNPMPSGANSNQISVIVDHQLDHVLAELRSRSHKRLRALYGTANLAGNPEREGARLTWLKDRAVISESEYAEQIVVCARRGKQLMHRNQRH